MKKVEGTYVGYRVSANDADSIYRFLKDNNIPCDRAEFHVTVLYSRKNHLDQFQPNPDLFHIGFHEEYEIFDNNQTKCLVMRLRCPSLIRRHQQLMEELGATYDFPVYYPHITVCDNIPDGFSTFKLPKFHGGIMINGEYSEELKLDWAPETSESIPVREILDNPDHLVHDEVFEKLEHGETHLTESLGNIQEHTEPEKADLISALDRIIERSESDEDEEGIVSSGEIPEEAMEKAAASGSD